MSATRGRSRSSQARRSILFATTCALAVSLSLDAKAEPPAKTSVPALQSSVVHGSPAGISLIRALGTDAASVLAPSTGMIGALVEVPPDMRAEDLGLETVAPGIGRIRGSAARIESFASAHPDLRLEAAPPLHPLMDRVALSVLAAQARQVRHADGRNVMIGVADTGLDVTHPEMRDAQGHSRVAWMLDLSLAPGGVHPELEQKFGIKDDDGKVLAGRVFSRADIDEMITRIEGGACHEKGRKLCAPADPVGHGTHVAGIAAATGASGGRYPGIAPAADIVFVRVTGGNLGGIENDNLVRAVEFMFDRATVESRPMVVNVSLGSDFGPHDGSFLWERALAAQVGADHPGRILVAAAGNSGSIVDSPIHQSVYVNEGTRMRVPIVTSGAEAGSVQVWVTLRRNANLKIGLEGPDGEQWVFPVESGREGGKNTDEYKAGIVYGADLPKSPIPDASRGAVVVWQGKWPAGTYNITFDGSGMAELYLASGGDAGLGLRPTAFEHGVREGTINLPATHPSIIGVGCTVNRINWSSIGGVAMALKVPVLDHEGGLPLADAVTPQADLRTHRELVDGEVCWFSSAGPTAAGVPKPEISAPGALVVSALSRNAEPGTRSSVFTRRDCPEADGKGKDPRCLQIDDFHGIAIGTSMSAPVVTGVVALLLQEDPSLTQDKVVALLQAGAHRFRVPAPYQGQGGPGEVDAMASLDALDQMKNPQLFLPVLEQSWLTLSADYVAADGSTPMTAIVELRAADGVHRGDFFDAPRLQPVVLVEGKPVAALPQMIRRGPGVWLFSWSPPPGLGGQRATFGATFDGAPVVSARTVPIATDHWSAAYANRAAGTSCGLSHVSSAPSAGMAVIGIFLAGIVRRIGRRRPLAR